MSPKVSRLLRRRPFLADDHWRRSAVTRRGFSLLGVIGISVTLLVIYSCPGMSLRERGIATERA
jgi:hypothetical protein